jgi:hypothetical protein
MRDFKREPISVLGARLTRAGVSQFADAMRANPGALAAYDQLAAPIVEEALNRVLPNEPLSLVDIADRIGIMPRKRNKGRRAIR